MTFAASARFSRCRSAHLSSWARRLNANLTLPRGIASAPLLRLAGEPQPIGGFVEQRVTIAGAITGMGFGEKDSDDASTDALIVAALLDGVLNLDSVLTQSFTKMLDLTARGSINGSCIMTTREGI
eukprot:CAMPEP_0117523072 /NCGR_PEP_ID=MMETSP0784-20121206/34536_1 /TAXON_ID=39447 /ORGANISM="" /LENGTH=125 /DNA_ID=CAMNT_0005319167 /DNA_START=34 /DNA_END=411 /DNA_ORIENTATION=+